MNAKDTYKIQQMYYYDFSFFPIRGLKKHNYFLFKAYTESGRKLNNLFDNLLNREVVDVNCIIGIRKKILKTGLPLTESVIGDLHSALHSLARLAPTFDKSCMLYVSGTAQSLQSVLNKYEEVQQQLTGEIKKLLGNNGFNTKYKTSSYDIEHVISVLQKLNKDISGSIDCFTDFSRRQPLPFTNIGALNNAKTYVAKLVTNLEKLLQMQQMIILQLRSWKRIRVMHERQQVLN